MYKCKIHYVLILLLLEPLLRQLNEMSVNVQNLRLNPSLAGTTSPTVRFTADKRKKLVLILLLLEPLLRLSGLQLTKGKNWS